MIRSAALGSHSCGQRLFLFVVLMSVFAMPATAHTACKIDGLVCSCEEIVCSTNNVIPACNQKCLATDRITCNPGTCVTGIPLTQNVCSCTAGSMGDPHLITYGGLLYDFQSIGEFVLATDSDGFSVQVRQEHWTRCASVNTAVAARLGENRIAIYARQSPALRVNGTPTITSCDSESAKDVLELSSVDSSSPCRTTIDLPDGGSVAIAKGNEETAYTLTPGGSQRALVVTRRATGTLDLRVPEGFDGSGPVSGLLGKPSSEATHELVTRDGRELPDSPTRSELYSDFGESWRVLQDESLFDYLPGENTSSFGDPLNPPVSCAISEAERRAATQECRSRGITSALLLEACTFDVATTGDPRFAKSYLGLAEPRAALRLSEEPNHRIVDARGDSGCSCRVAPTRPGEFGMVASLIAALWCFRRVAKVRPGHGERNLG